MATQVVYETGCPTFNSFSDIFKNISKQPIATAGATSQLSYLQNHKHYKLMFMYMDFSNIITTYFGTTPDYAKIITSN